MRLKRKLAAKLDFVESAPNSSRSLRVAARVESRPESSPTGAPSAERAGDSPASPTGVGERGPVQRC
ncbi:hypothetical protein EYF80_040841 [Liparis tanakae]|uniref:Uncharacterized protein n=1 Tax=Liparis tanakae TaxID=230148 RepID=A0A4Z2G6T7_9TELE|nr:hypothetical protein EYF80_040841 [Liparis tanakae]